MKKCTKCGQLKDLSEFFNSSRNKCGKRESCKVCETESVARYKRTKEGLIMCMFKSQLTNSRRRKHRMPDYTLTELRNWCLKQSKFDNLYDKWVNSNYNKMLIPSLDRIDDSKHYSFDNVQLMTWKENREKEALDMRNGKLIVTKNPQKAISQFDENGNFIKDYVSLNEACRQTGINTGSIYAVLNNKRKSCKGFIWKYK